RRTRGRARCGPSRTPADEELPRILEIAEELDATAAAPASAPRGTCCGDASQCLTSAAARSIEYAARADVHRICGDGDGASAAATTPGSIAAGRRIRRWLLPAGE